MSSDSHDIDTISAVTRIACQYFNIVMDESEQSMLYGVGGSLYRSRLHNSLSDALDVDRELIAELLEKCRTDNWRPEPLGVDLDKAFDQFLYGLRVLRALPAEKRRRVESYGSDPLAGIDFMPELGAKGK